MKTEANVCGNSRTDQRKRETQSHKLCRGFDQTMKARITCFMFSFIKLLFSVLTKRIKDDYDARMSIYFNFFHQTVNSHNLEIANHIATSFFRAS